jgi:hypothetical protein
MYANARLACAAHEKEMMEATARIQAQRELAAAQAQAAQRALTVAREKAAHEVRRGQMLVDNLRCQVYVYMTHAGLEGTLYRIWTRI